MSTRYLIYHSDDTDEIFNLHIIEANDYFQIITDILNNSFTSQDLREELAKYTDTPAEYEPIVNLVENLFTEFRYFLTWSKLAVEQAEIQNSECIILIDEKNFVSWEEIKEQL